MAFGAKLLEETDNKVDQGHAADRHPRSHIPNEEQGNRDRHHKHVEECEEIASNDVEILEQIRSPHAIDLSARNALGDLSGRQSGECRGWCHD